MSIKLIGVFDSGVGGLTVLASLRRRIKTASYIYLGDTARLPYGTKSKDSVLKYSIDAVNFLISKNVDMIVVACNTATSISLKFLQEKFPVIPIIGVIDSGARTAIERAGNGRVAVIATKNTIFMSAYENAMRKLCPNAMIVSKACPLLVSLAEEGWIADGVARNVVKKYITPIMEEFLPHKPDCLVLGCTHFPFFRDVIAEIVGSEVEIIDSAESTSSYIYDKYFKYSGVYGSSNVDYYVTDSPENFINTGKMLLNDDISSENVKLISVESLYNDDSVNLKSCINVFKRYNSEYAIKQNKLIYDKIFLRIIPLLQKIEFLDSKISIRSCVDDIKNILLNIIGKYPEKFNELAFFLTPSERLVSEMVIEGLCSKDIAKKMNLSIATVHSHRRNIRKKLRISNSKMDLQKFFLE